MRAAVPGGTQADLHGTGGLCPAVSQSCRLRDHPAVPQLGGWRHTAPAGLSSMLPLWARGGQLGHLPSHRGVCRGSWICHTLHVCHHQILTVVPLAQPWGLRAFSDSTQAQPGDGMAHVKLQPFTLWRVREYKCIMQALLCQLSSIQKNSLWPSNLSAQM